MTSILTAFAKVIKTINSCHTLEQLDNCSNYLESFKIYSERKDYKEWIHEINVALLDKATLIKESINIEIQDVIEPTNDIYDLSSAD